MTVPLRAALYVRVATARQAEVTDTEVRIGMARPGGFEPPTHSLEGYCSIQLS